MSAPNMHMTLSRESKRPRKRSRNVTFVNGRVIIIIIAYDTFIGRDYKNEIGNKQWH